MENISDYLLVVSVTVNVGVLILLLTRKAIVTFLPIGRSSGKSCCGLLDYVDRLRQEARNILLPKFFVAIIWCWVIISMSIDVIRTKPRDLLDKPFTSRGSGAISALVASNVGYSLLRAGHDAMMDLDVPLFKVEAICHVVTVSSYVIYLVMRQNSLMACVGVLPGFDCMFTDFKEVLQELGFCPEDKAYLAASVAYTVSVVVTRLLLPAGFFILAVNRESPLSMHYVTLSALFSSIVFFSIVNLLKLKSAIALLRQSYVIRKAKRSLCDAAGQIIPMTPHGTMGNQTPSNVSFLRNELLFKRACSNVNVNSNGTTGGRESKELQKIAVNTIFGASEMAALVHQSRTRNCSLNNQSFNMTEAAYQSSRNSSDSSDSNLSRSGMVESLSQLAMTT